MELDSIQSEWREPRFAERQSRAGCHLATATRQFLARAALKRHPAGLHNSEELPFQDKILLAMSLAGAARVREDYFD